MTNQQLIKLRDALGALSGSVTQLHQGKPVDVTFRFTGSTRFEIARFSRAVKQLLEPFDDAREAIIRQHGGPFTAAGAPGHAEATAELSKLLDADVTAVLNYTLPKDEFLANDNPVSPELIEALIDFIQ